MVVDSKVVNSKEMPRGSGFQSAGPVAKPMVRPHLPWLLHMLLLATMGFILSKLADIVDDRTPFVPMSRTVATVLDFKPSHSPRAWLALHWASAVAMVLGLARGVVVGRWTTFDLCHWVMSALLMANVTRFGTLPLHTALLVNVGFLCLACLSWFGLRRWRKPWCLTAYVCAAGMPVFAEVLVYFGYEAWYRLFAPPGAVHLMAADALWWTLAYSHVAVAVTYLHLRPSSRAYHAMVRGYARLLRNGMLDVVWFGSAIAYAMWWSSRGSSPSVSEIDPV